MVDLLLYLIGKFDAKCCTLQTFSPRNKNFVQKQVKNYLSTTTGVNPTDALGITYLSAIKKQNILGLFWLINVWDSGGVFERALFLQILYKNICNNCNTWLKLKFSERTENIKYQIHAESYQVTAHLRTRARLSSARWILAGFNRILSFLPFNF